MHVESHVAKLMHLSAKLQHSSQHRLVRSFFTGKEVSPGDQTGCKSLQSSGRAG